MSETDWYQVSVDLRIVLTKRNNTIARLEAELAAERKDAERYRWLRDHKPNYFIEFRVEKIIPRGPCEPDWETVSKTRLDSTIDAAMKEQKP